MHLIRFTEEIQLDDVLVDPEDPDFILPPRSGPVGVVFFAPVHESFETAVKALRGRAQCVSVRVTELPIELGVTQCKLMFNLDKDGDDRFPFSSFSSLSNNKRKEKLDHVLIFMVYPAIRMKLETFKALIQQLPAQPNENNTYASSAWEPSRTAAPSSLRMRFVCEALYAFVFAARSSNDALFAFALYHHIGASDVSFEDMRNACSITRLIYRAIEKFDPPPVYLDLLAETVYEDILRELHQSKEKMEGSGVEVRNTPPTCPSPSDDTADRIKS